METSARVPTGMSYVNAWHALYSQANEKGAFFNANPASAASQEDMVSTSEKVANLFRSYPTNKAPLYYMEYEGGKKMKVHFCDFPQLDIYYYDQTYGTGAAQRALNEYDKIPSANRFDKNDSYRFSDLRQR